MKIPTSWLLATFFAAIGMSASTPADAQMEYYYIKSESSHKCAHVQGGSMADGAPVTLWDCVNQNNVKWTKINPRGEWFQLQAKHSQKCLHQHGSVAHNNARITQWACVSSPNLYWREKRVGEAIQLVAENSDSCLHIPGAAVANGTPLTQWDCNVVRPHGLWRLVPAPN